MAKYEVESVCIIIILLPYTRHVKPSIMPIPNMSCFQDPSKPTYMFQEIVTG